MSSEEEGGFGAIAISLIGAAHRMGINGTKKKTPDSSTKEKNEPVAI